MWLSLLVFLSFSVFSATEKTSEIPERREFPVNKSVNPCQDFYRYTCSKAIDSFKLREDRSRHIFSFSDSSERLLKTKEDYLKGLTRLENKTKGEKELSDVFLACINRDQRASDEKDLVKKTKKEVEALTSREGLVKFLGHRVGTSDFTFFDFGEITNQDNVNKNDLYVVANVRGLPEKSYYKDKKILKAYKKLVENFFKTIGYKDYKKRAKWVVEFEVDFDKNYPTPQEWRVIWTKREYISRKTLLNDYSIFHLEEFMTKIPKKTVIRNFTPKTYNFMKTSLEKESVDKLKSVFLYHALSSKMDEGYKDFFNKKFAFRKTHLGGPNKRRNLTERCTYYVKRSFAKEIDYELYPRVFGNFSKKKFVSLVKKVRSALLEELKENTWLSEKGKKSAIKKMKTASLQVVKPNNEKEWNFIEKADYSPKYFLANKKLRKDKIIAKTIKEIKKGPNRKAWNSGPLLVNAYYNPTINRFVMPAGILQYPFYDQNLPDHVNLGAIGVIVGHELGHGIDDKGSKYDHKGRLKQWMSKKDLKEFKNRGNVLVSQFDKIGHNGKLALGENIGDLVGLTSAYRAAFPGGEGTQQAKKEFFTQYGRAWCGVMRPGERRRRLKIGPHSLIEARVNEQVKHQSAFSEAFSCKPGDKMHLSEDKRVKIW